MTPRGGAYSRNKGAKAERDLANYLRTWWPKADRLIRTGYKTSQRTKADEGDIHGVPGVVWSVKHVEPKAAAQPSVVATWWAELDAMLEADPVALGILVERRHHAPDPSTWWAHLRLGDLVALHGGHRGPAAGDRDPARVTVQTCVDLLVAAGYARNVA